MSFNQSQLSGKGSGDDGAENSESAAGQVHITTAGTDDLLAEIDGLLETNAEEFVRSYVQKGGQ